MSREDGLHFRELSTSAIRDREEIDVWAAQWENGLGLT